MGEMGKEEGFRPKDIPKARHRKRKYVKRRDISRFDPGDSVIGLEPYPSIRRERITLTKRN